jgi:hypothetical protein
MYLKICILLFLVVSRFISYSQSNLGVCISPSPEQPNPSAMLEVKSDNKGILLPRLTLAQRNLIAAPAEGLWIYQLDDVKGFYSYKSGHWECMSCCCNMIDEAWVQFGSNALLSNQTVVPNFDNCFTNVAQPTNNHRSLSIRKTIDGKIKIQGEFKVNCPIEFCTNFTLINALPFEYKSSSSSVITLMSPILINNVATTDVSVSKCHTTTNYIGLTSNISIAANSILYIDIEYIP